jgi:uncharacterized protein (TIGR02266 family)
LTEHFRRTDPRYVRRLLVEISWEGGRVEAQSRNLSLGGMFIETDAPFPLETTIALRFRVPTQPEPVEVTGEIRWVEKGVAGPVGVGVRFHGLRARDVWALNRFFANEPR